MSCGAPGTSDFESSSLLPSYAVSAVRSESDLTPEPTHIDESVETAASAPDAVVAPSARALVLQRAFDVTLAALGCLLFAIPVVVLALGVKLTSRGPVLFVQRRDGHGGDPFDVYKFRTMRDGTHREVLDDEAARQAYHDNDFKLPPDDPRITAIGRLLRKTSLDELPQLVNVLRGEMSIVGVRPLLAEEVAMRPAYDQALYRTKRPGMTGLWQVEGRSTVQKIDRLHLDRRYLEEWSVWGDVKIAARTPFAVLRISHAH